MRCTDPRDRSFDREGKMAFSPRKFSKEFAIFKGPCGQCIECRLEYAREWAIRCVHESKMHTKNAFITLTYDEQHLKSDKLDYSHFQKFMKKLRKTQNEPMGFFVTGEYGERTKRPHWHAIIFNWRPSDAQYKYSNDRGDKVYSSSNLEKLWGQGTAEFGSVTFESAGYCARYAAKKLVHGLDGAHEYKPISKKSSKHAIGKKWLETNFEDVFRLGKIVLHNGSETIETGIPRYYERWLKEKHPERWVDYVTRVKYKMLAAAQNKTDLEEKIWRQDRERRRDLCHERKILPLDPLRPEQVRKIISDSKFNQLQSYLKLK